MVMRNRRHGWRLAGFLVVLLALTPTLGGVAMAQSDETVAGPDQVVVFVLDLSGSMNEPFDAGRTKLDVANRAEATAVAYQHHLI